MQLEAQRLLAVAIAAAQNEDADAGQKLRDAMDKANDLALNLDAVDRVRAMLREQHNEATNYDDEEDDDQAEIDVEEQERKRQEMLDRARQPRFRFVNYDRLRSPDDYARGALLAKKKIKDHMLKWQNTIITKSLIKLDDREHVKLAIRIHKALLGYMGDKQMSFPATLAQDILTKGLECPAIQDEIYMQIMKQLSHNPKPESIAKGWQVMCMCVSTFPPSQEFKNYLLNYILDKCMTRGAVRNYAKYCLRSLEGMLQSGASGFVPSVEEIQAYKERPPILATIELVDGMVLTEELPVTPDLNVAKVLEICTHFLDLQDERKDTMGIFVYDVPPSEDSPQQDDPAAGQAYADLERTPRPLRNEDYMGDVIVQKARQRRNFKFVFKKKIFLESQQSPSEDQMYERLMYLQAEDEVICTGNIRIEDEAKLIRLCAISMAVALDHIPETVQGLVDNDLLEFIPASARDRYSVENWADKILSQKDDVMSMSTVDCQLEFVEAVQDHPFYGTHFFHVHKLNNSPEIVAQLPVDLTIAFNESGLHVLDTATMTTRLEFGYSEIYRWGGSSSQFSLIIWNQDTESTFELILTTAQAPDMAAIILDFINAIMSNAGP